MFWNSIYSSSTAALKKPLADNILQCYCCKNARLLWWLLSWCLSGNRPNDPAAVAVVSVCFSLWGPKCSVWSSQHKLSITCRCYGNSKREVTGPSQNYFHGSHSSEILINLTCEQLIGRDVWPQREEFSSDASGQSLTPSQRTSVRTHVDLSQHRLWSGGQEAVKRRVQIQTSEPKRATECCMGSDLLWAWLQVLCDLLWAWSQLLCDLLWVWAEVLWNLASLQIHKHF